MHRRLPLILALVAGLCLPPSLADADCGHCGEGGSSGGGEGGKKEGGGGGGFGVSIDLGRLLTRASKDKASGTTTDQPTLTDDPGRNTPQDDELVNDLADAFAKEFGGQTRERVPGGAPGTQPREPQGPQEGDDPRDEPPPVIYGEAVDAPCGIHLEHDVSTWIPDAHVGDKTTLTAKIYRKVGTEWVFPGPERIITFEFVQCSNERGEALNHGDGEEPDLFFPPVPNAHLDVLNDPVGQGKHYNTARTKSPRDSEQSVVESDDYGGYSTVRATAPPCIPLKRSARGKLVEAERQEEADVKVPRDDNDNQIADTYEQRKGRQPKAGDDDDSVPEGNGVAGDGLSAYEEYRGFLVQGQHTRTDWTQKDLFIYDRDSVGIGPFPGASGFACHLIKEDEYDEDRVVNRNPGHAHLVEQHGLRLVQESMEGVSGHSEGFGPPKNVEEVKVDKEDFIFGRTRRTFNESAFHGTVAHELGHATGARHHSDFFFGDGGYVMFYPPGGVPASAKAAYAASWLNPLVELVREDYEEHTAATLCGQQLPKRAWVGKKGNRHSGHTSCFMRYPHGDALSVYEGAGGWECVGQDEPDRELFCEGSGGTGYNAGGRCAANAEKGDCKHQLVVNDNS